MKCSVKSSGPSLLLLSILFYIVNSYPNSDGLGCGECTLRKNRLYSSDEKPIYQCMGCCFSRAYPTPLKSRRTMAIPKNITSEATCCVARASYEVYIAKYNLTVRNHTECHCSTCYHHKH